MKTIKITTIFLTIFVLLFGVVACDEEAPMEESVSMEEAVPLAEAVSEEEEALSVTESDPEADTSEEDIPEDEDASTDAPLKGNIIPIECLIDEDAFEECWEAGLISEDCFDDEDYLLDSCLPDEDEMPAEADEADEPDEEAPDNETTAPPATTDGSAAEADSGFRPEVNGFNFWNYGDEFGGLTASEMQRMFGNNVCANTVDGCTLTPPAQQWMEQMNGYMAGGHCEGMAVLSSLMYYDQVNPQNFGGNVAYELDINNEALQREIAYWFVTQGTYPGGYQKISESPSAVVNTLMNAFNQGQNAPEWWAMGIYKSDFSGGHAITPFAVDDLGNGLYNIWVYDNNFPKETRLVEVDTNNETWQYQASTHPDVPEELYTGDASLQNLEVVAISPRLGPQECEFCAGGGEVGHLDNSRSAGLAKADTQADAGVYQIWLSGQADLLIIDEQDRRLGYDNGEFINEIPGAGSESLKFGGIEVWATDNEPIYRIPADLDFEILVDGSSLSAAENSAVSMIGPGYYMAVEDIWLEPGEIDSIAVTTDGPRQQLTYFTDYADSPIIELGIETPDADYAFLVQATNISGEEDAFDVGIDFEIGDFIVDAGPNTEPITFDVYVLRIDDQGEYVFGTDDLTLEPNTRLFLNYQEWVADGTVMYGDFDYNNDGEIDESLELPDEADTWFED